MKKLLVYLREYRRESILGPLFKLLEASFELIVPLVVEQLLQMLAELKDEMKMALLFISHDIRLVRNFCDRACVLQDGRIVEQGDMLQIYEHPENDYTRRLVNAAILNLLD